MTKQQEIFNDWGAETFVGNNYDYYQRMFQKSISGKNFSSWNWSAFIFPVYWLFYRKMYKEAFILTILLPFSYFTLIGAIPLHIIIGMFANSVYYSKGLSIIKNSLNLQESDAKIYVEEHGGTSFKAVFLAVLVMVSISVGTIMLLISFDTSTDNLENSTIETTTSTENKSSSKNEKTKDVKTKNGEITFTVPIDFTEKTEHQDLYCENSNDIWFSSFVYDEIDFADTDARKDILEIHVEDLKTLIEDVSLEDIKISNLDDSIIQEIYSGKDSGFKVYTYVSVEKIDKYYVVVISSALPSKWDKNEAMIGDIVSSARLSE